jgi:hypothetical protein
MGLGQSVQLQGATEELLGRTGRFSLRADQKMVDERMALLLSTILESNNLFDLEALLKDSIKCDQLMLVVGSLIKKEFRTIRLPDPTSRGAALPVSFMTKDQYKAVESDKGREVVCNTIAWFILRFCTVITALIGSVRINEKMSEYIDSASIGSLELTMNHNFTDPILPDEIKTVLHVRQRPISAEILNDLVMNKTLRRVTLADAQTNDARPIYTLNDKRYVINTTTQCVYKSFTVKETQIFGIEMSIAQPINLERQRDPRANRPRYEAPDSRNAQPARSRHAGPTRTNRTNRSDRSDPSRYDRPNTFMPEWNARTTTTRATVPAVFRTHGGSYHTRKNKHKAQYGGDGHGEKWYKVRLIDLLKCATDQCEIVGTFFMNSDGFTVSDTEYDALLNKKPTDKYLQFPPVTDRLDKFFTDKYIKYATKPPSESTTYAQKKGIVYLPINKADKDSYDRLESLHSAINFSSEGVSPAQYRAYLLATSIDSATATDEVKSRGLHTRFCGDSWGDLSKVTNIAAYALLQALYSDRPDGSREALTAEALRRDAIAFVGEKLLEQSTKTGASVDAFDNLKFPEIPKELKTAFCDQIVKFDSQSKNSGDRVTRQETDVAILMNAHKELRKLYDEQLQGVFNLLVTLMSAKSTGYDKAPLLILHEDFSKDPRGALVVLEERIAAARALLVNHYQAVERVYRGALNALKQRIQGVYNSGRKL